jgi:Fe-S-cluster-containing dehydrogenase component/DMSO reductase anchor subunit
MNNQIPTSEVNLIDRLVAEQQNMTAVERFAQKHERSDFHAQAQYYEDLIPLSKPVPGQQYAFAVNLDKCTGCKACVSACHSLNGLEDEEIWRDVGLLFGGHRSEPYQQTVTTACHHCLEPGCLEGCPVKAYEKDSDTGIVRHLDDQCIGCQYCTMKCPYDVPKYSKKLGIVRKCDMCHDRLAVGEAPACVQACPHEAISIRLIDIAEVSAAATPESALLPGTFTSSYTKPTTLYTTSKKMPADTHPADAYRLHLEHAHWPLLIMLVLSQGAVGLFLGLALSCLFFPAFYAATGLPIAATGFAILNVGLVAAVFHLGRPLGAWRFFLGLRTSWMSREILAFSIFAAVASGALLVISLQSPFVLRLLPPPLLPLISMLPLPLMAIGVTLTASVFGLVAVFTSAMIYIDTHRPFWKASLTLNRFYGATLTLGASLTALAAALLNLPKALDTAIVCTLIFQTFSFLFEMSRHADALNDSEDANHMTALTQHQLLPWIVPARALSFIVTSLLLIAVLTGSIPPVYTALAVILIFIGQTVERFAFFTTVRAPHMPRGI